MKMNKLLLCALAWHGLAQAASVQPTTDGGYVLFGNYGFATTGEHGFDGSALFKVDRHGAVQWSLPMAGGTDYNGFDENFSFMGNAMQTPDGGYIVSFINYDTMQGHLAKTNALGTTIEWDHAYGTHGDGFHAVRPVTDGGYIAAGLTQSMGAGDFDGWLLKVDASGTLQWSLPYGTSGHEELAGVRPTSDGGYIAIGSTKNHPMGFGAYDGWLLKVDRRGRRTWDVMFGGDKDDQFTDVQQTMDGGYIISGYATPSPNAAARGWLMKVDQNSQVQWSMLYAAGPTLTAVQQTTDCGYIACGHSRATEGTSDELDFWLLKTDENGNPQWQKTLGTPGNDLASSLQQTPDGGYVVYGQADSSNGTLLIKIDANGDEDWRQSYSY